VNVALLVLSFSVVPWIIMTACTKRERWSETSLDRAFWSIFFGGVAALTELFKP